MAVLCRLQMDEELRQREREREREREKEREREADREREKEREREREREKELEREREKERELERQRERAREKELSMVKAMEGPFLPVAELHGLRGHPAEERSKPAEPLAPGRPGNVPTGDMVGGTAAFSAACHGPQMAKPRGSAGGPGRWLGMELPARCARSPAAAALGEVASVPSDSVQGGTVPGEGLAAPPCCAGRGEPGFGWRLPHSSGCLPPADPRNTLVANNGCG